jgi:hypothetical protein
VARHTAAELLNILAAREGRGSTLVTSQFDLPDWYKSLQDAVIAESILDRIVAGVEVNALDGPNMRRHLAATAPSDLTLLIAADMREATINNRFATSRQVSSALPTSPRFGLLSLRLSANEP